MLNLFQLETEYLRLRERWRQAAADPASAREQLQLRYDIFHQPHRLAADRSRAARVVGQPGVRLRSGARAARFCRPLRSLPRAVAQAPFSSASMKALLADLEALDAPVHQMLLAGAHRVAQQVTTRSDAIAQHNRVGIALTVFLSGMVGLFGYLALRRMRQLEDSRRALEAMANHLNDAREQALRASQAKSEFLTNMSHADPHAVPRHAGHAGVAARVQARRAPAGSAAAPRSIRPITCSACSTTSSTCRNSKPAR